MKVLDLLGLINEYTNIKIVDVDDVVLSQYDGKNSIENIYLDVEIEQIKVEDNTIYIVVNN